jgi:hypothetical protein
MTKRKRQPPRTQVSVHLDHGLLKFVERGAAREDRTRGAQVRHIVAEAARREREELPQEAA